MNSAVIAPPIITQLGLTSVNHSADLKKLIRDCRLDVVQPEILDNLPQFNTGRQGIDRTNIFIAHFNCLIGLLPAIRALSHLEFRGADFRELLAVCVRFPSLQCQFPLMAVGAGCKNKEGDCGVPYLWYQHQIGNRTLLLNWAAGYQDRLAREFQPFCRFVVVSKNPADLSAN